MDEIGYTAPIVREQPPYLKRKEHDIMLTHENIVDAVTKTAMRFSLKKVSYFGSYADGNATEQSDLDLLVEFTRPNVSLWTIADLKYDLEDELNIPVDVIHSPLPQGTIIKIGKTIPVYE
jgi:predicted nucleotidyltransferase